MNRKYTFFAVLFLIVTTLVAPLQLAAGEAASIHNKQLIYDEAGLLSQEAYNELNALANQYGVENETDIIIVTVNNESAIDVKRMTQGFYDEHAPGYDKPHGNAVILTLDMHARELYLAGFYKAKLYLDDKRLDRIRDQIAPDLTAGNYKQAFETYIQTAHEYMGFKPGVNPDNPFYKVWVQLGISVLIGGIIVTAMVYRSGGRVTVNARTYEDAASSGIIDNEDTYLHTNTTKRKIEKSSSGGSSGGGGTTSGGHSHSGSRGSF
ncbi:TPM domain-containing protein [Paenibacillus taiwanensis]|uniref:TPM domain-containing protein n=1 Tax=Paenibacillus taiwanensis TaxID=401638 RepID=UPI000400B03E|nr:TPM domain-containing protein [Paenibacillus taiwanensis]